MDALGHILPLIAGVLLLLWLVTRHLAPNPRTEFGEHEKLEKLTSSTWGAVLVAVGVAVVASLALLLMTLALRLSLPAIVVYVVLAIGGLMFVASFTMSFVRVFGTVAGKIVAVAYALAAFGAWILWPNWLTVNLLAVVLVVAAMSGLLQMTLNFKLAAIVVGGLFIYDIINVYFTGNMLKVAGAALDPVRPMPMLLIVPSGLDLHSKWAAALGTGDVLVPGMLILIAGVLAHRHNRPSILYGGLVGYLVGFAAVEVILLLAHHGQPALITLYPCVMGGILLMTWRAGLLRELFALRHEKPAQNSPEALA